MSDPSAINLPIHTALTSDMMLGLKPSAPKSRSYRISIAPMNKSTFAGGDQMIFELPTGRRGTWYDPSQSYLKFSVQVQTTAAISIANANLNAVGGVRTDNTAYSFLQRLDVYNSSNLLETINNYGDLANMLIDTSLTQSDKAGIATLIGANAYNSQYLLTNTAAAYAQNAVVVPVFNATAGDRNGMSLSTTTAIANSPAYTFSLPILSGVVGVNASKMLPVGKLNAPIRCEFYLSSNDDALFYGTAGAGCTWLLVYVEFVCCYVEVQDDSFVNDSSMSYNLGIVYPVVTHRFIIQQIMITTIVL